MLDFDLTGLLPNRYRFSLGAAFFRIWDDQQGLVLELPPCVVIDKETGEIRLYGQEAAAIEDRVPSHLEFRRAWWGDKILDRQVLISLLQYALASASPGNAEKKSPWLAPVEEHWRRVAMTSFLLEESMLHLHRRWLLRTAREAGWWLAKGVPAQKGLQRPPKPGSPWHIQGLLDVGFSATRFSIYLGNELIFASSTEEFSLSRFCTKLSEFLLEFRHIRVSPASFYDQNWTKVRPVFDEQKKKAESWSVDMRDWEDVCTQFWAQMGEWLEGELAKMEVSQRTELTQRETLLLGGGATLWQEKLSGKIPVFLRKAPDAVYASLRAKSD